MSKGIGNTSNFIIIINYYQNRNELIFIKSFAVQNNFKLINYVKSFLD